MEDSPSFAELFAFAPPNAVGSGGAVEPVASKYVFVTWIVRVTLTR